MSNDVDIYALLGRQYREGIVLEPNEPCGVCKRDKTASDFLVTLPEFLILQLSRFKAGEKSHMMVRFPATGLNLLPYVEPKFRSTLQTSFDLQSVIHHVGSTMRQGHYITFNRRSSANDWVRHDDERMTVVGIDAGIK